MPQAELNPRREGRGCATPERQTTTIGCGGAEVAYGGGQELPPLPTPLAGWDPMGIRPRYGSYRGFIRLVLAEIENLAGLRRFAPIRWASVTRLVFVCRGNICRSPYAERRAASCGLPAASFGLAAATGGLADPTASRIAGRRGVQLAHHRACDFSDFVLCGGDLLVVMEPRQMREIMPRLPPLPLQMTLLGRWSRPRRLHLHDPFRLSEAYWERCFDIIDSAVQGIAEQMRPSLSHARS